jgi:T-complex protein 1 subunit gamma
MELSCRLSKLAETVEGTHQWPYRALASAIEVIPRTLAQNCGGDVVRMLTDLRARHNGEGEEAALWGVNGNTVKIENMNDSGIWDPAAVKLQTYKTAIESACMLLRIDDIVSGIQKQGRHAGGRKALSDDEEDETFGDARDG